MLYIVILRSIASLHLYYCLDTNYFPLVWPSRYLLYYILSYAENINASYEFAGFALVCLLVGLIALGKPYFLKILQFYILFWFLFQSENFHSMAGRIYLGMHSPIDIIFGLVFGLMVLLFWLNVHECVDSFITTGQNGIFTFSHFYCYPFPPVKFRFFCRSSICYFQWIRCIFYEKKKYNTRKDESSS